MPFRYLVNALTDSNFITRQLFKDAY